MVFKSKVGKVLNLDNDFGIDAMYFMRILRQMTIIQYLFNHYSTAIEQ